jgi:hypothetical protein
MPTKTVLPSGNSHVVIKPDQREFIVLNLIHERANYSRLDIAK